MAQNNNQAPSSEAFAFLCNLLTPELNEDSLWYLLYSFRKGTDDISKLFLDPKSRKKMSFEDKNCFKDNFNKIYPTLKDILSSDLFQKHEKDIKEKARSILRDLVEFHSLLDPVHGAAAVERNSLQEFSLVGRGN